MENLTVEANKKLTDKLQRKWFVEQTRTDLKNLIAKINQGKNGLKFDRVDNDTLDNIILCLSESMDSLELVS